MSELRNFDSLFRLDGKVALVTGGKFGADMAVSQKHSSSDAGSQDLEDWVCMLQLHFYAPAQRR
jgi:hypothetical protein